MSNTSRRRFWRSVKDSPPEEKSEKPVTATLLGENTRRGFLKRIASWSLLPKIRFLSVQGQTKNALEQALKTIHNQQNIAKDILKASDSVRSSVAEARQFCAAILAKHAKLTKEAIAAKKRYGLYEPEHVLCHVTAKVFATSTGKPQIFITGNVAPDNMSAEEIIDAANRSCETTIQYFCTELPNYHLRRQQGESLSAGDKHVENSPGNHTTHASSYCDDTQTALKAMKRRGPEHRPYMEKILENFDGRPATKQR